MTSFRLLASLLVASSASAAVSPTMTRQYPGLSDVYNQVSCTANSAIAPNNGVGSATPYERLSILIKNCDPIGGNTVVICPGSTTCNASAGMQLAPRESFWLDWSTGPISCSPVSAAGLVCFVEERG